MDKNIREYVSDINPDSDTLKYDVVIIGSGVAGLYAALNLDKSIKCAILNKHGTNECNSIYAQGGIASVILKGDSAESHITDTLKAGAGLCKEDAVKLLVTEGPSDVEKLIEIGVPFDREDGKLCASREAAHSFNRILHCGGDATGFHITVTLLNEAKKRSNIKFFNSCMVCDVITDTNGDAWGVSVKDGENKDFCIQSSNVIIASGGIGRVYRNTTNSSPCTGDGIASAIRAKAEYENMEFVQFHPTALIHPDLNMRFFLISEALRGEGGVLLNRKGERFMQSNPMGELAPRDVVSRSIISEMKKNDLSCVYLDISFKGRDYLKKRFPVIYEECMKRGIDIAVNWLPVIPVQHYFMGGIKTDLLARTNIKGLYACGEASCTGVHGANRLASNSLLECLVFGRHAAEDINGKTAAKRGNPILYTSNKIEKANDFETYRTKIKHIMTQKVGIIRKKAELLEAKEEIGKFYTTLNKCKLNTVRETETLNMAFVSLKIIEGAINRKQSIGAHYRED